MGANEERIKGKAEELKGKIKGAAGDLILPELLNDLDLSPAQAHRGTDGR